MTTYSREDDLVVALQEATKLMAGARFDQLAQCNGDKTAAQRVTEVADVFVAWLRRVKRVVMTLVRVEEIDNPTVFIVPSGGASAMTNIDTSQRARYVLDSADDRGFALDAALAARSSDESVVTVEIIEASASDSGKDELLATFAGTLGTATVEVFDSANPDIVLAADVIVANPGAVASVALGTPTIEEIPTPEV